MSELFKDLLGSSPQTTICGVIAIASAGVALCMGKLDFQNFMLVVSLVAGGVGLVKAKDSK